MPKSNTPTYRIITYQIPSFKNTRNSNTHHILFNITNYRYPFAQERIQKLHISFFAKTFPDFFFAQTFIFWGGLFIFTGILFEFTIKNLRIVFLRTCALIFGNFCLKKLNRVSCLPPHPFRFGPMLADRPSSRLVNILKSILFIILFRSVSMACSIFLVIYFITANKQWPI